MDATEADKQVVSDLLDTLRNNLEHCVGIAANMIGVRKNIIVVAAGTFQFVMINPIITKNHQSCLSSLQSYVSQKRAENEGGSSSTYKCDISPKEAMRNDAIPFLLRRKLFLYTPTVLQSYSTHPTS